MLQTDFGGLRVAVIDTGVDSSHPDLNVVHHEDIVAAHTGDDADGGDPIGHGTHVAGTIGARADGVGVVGVAPGVEIVDVRVLGSDGTGYMTDILAGIEYVADHPDIRVVNLSLGGPAGGGLDDEVDAALANLEASGVLLAIAAGNDGRNVSNTVPAGLDRGVVVSAYSHRGGEDRGFASFSNFGEAVDVTAPGVGILSTWPGGGYAALDGTSMATPHVAGLAAVLLSEEPELDAAEARRRIVNTGEGDLFGANSKHDEPMVDLQAALDN
jgi:subtilisin family serine protease